MIGRRVWFETHAKMALESEMKRKFDAGLLFEISSSPSSKTHFTSLNPSRLWSPSLAPPPLRSKYKRNVFTSSRDPQTKRAQKLHLTIFWSLAYGYLSATFYIFFPNAILTYFILRFEKSCHHKNSQYGDFSRLQKREAEKHEDFEMSSIHETSTLMIIALAFWFPVSGLHDRFLGRESGLIYNNWASKLWWNASSFTSLIFSSFSPKPSSQRWNFPILHA